MIMAGQLKLSWAIPIYDFTVTQWSMDRPLAPACFPTGGWTITARDCVGRGVAQWRGSYGYVENAAAIA